MQVQRQFLDITTRQVLIELPESFINRRVELIALAPDEEVAKTHKRRTPHPTIAGKGRTVGDLLEPLVEDADWSCLK